MATGSRGDAQRRFWDRCQNLHIKQGVIPTAARCAGTYSVRSSSCCRFPDDARPICFDRIWIVTPVALGHDSGLQPRQFRQAVDAIRNLHSIVGTEWAIDVDWAFWRDSSRTLEEQHATTARQRAPRIPGSVHRYRFLSPIDALRLD